MDEHQPFCRAAIRHDAITLSPWTPALLRRGPAAMTLDRTTAALCDLSQLGDGELLVAPVARTPFGAWAEAELIAWATTVGYRRLWLADRVVDLASTPMGYGAAGVGCPTCGIAWEDGSVEFWESVRDDGHFPGFCLACGSSLPEWTVTSDAGDGSSANDLPTEASALERWP